MIYHNTYLYDYVHIISSILDTHKWKFLIEKPSKVLYATIYWHVRETFPRRYFARINNIFFYVFYIGLVSSYEFGRPSAGYLFSDLSSNTRPIQRAASCPKLGYGFSSHLLAGKLATLRHFGTLSFLLLEKLSAVESWGF